MAIPERIDSPPNCIEVERQCPLNHTWTEHVVREFGHSYTDGPLTCPECGLDPGDALYCVYCGDEIGQARIEVLLKRFGPELTTHVFWLCEKCELETNPIKGKPHCSRCNNNTWFGGTECVCPKCQLLSMGRKLGISEDWIETLLWEVNRELLTEIAKPA